MEKIKKRENRRNWTVKKARISRSRKPDRSCWMEIPGNIRWNF